MAREVKRGEVRLYAFRAPDKRRPVLVLSRQVLLDVLQTATLVPITSAAHGAPTEVELGVEDGLKGPCCANLANVQTVRQQDLSRLVGSVRPEKMSEICRALAVAVGCD
ncbi:MAG: type II toxin-antitoxin system PemK/MazF family toxin [Sorangiineae bacterium PRO1]|nr:type II toxin-antitoxin system PemK/MazF family toxin [Sorangiineae bacterium PRO1]